VKNTYNQSIVKKTIEIGRKHLSLEFEKEKYRKKPLVAEIANKVYSNKEAGQRTFKL